MVGALIVAHSHIGKELIATAKYLVGKMDGIVAVSIDFKMNTFEARKVISEAIREVDQIGVNLPMVLTFWNKRWDMGLKELAKSLQPSGKRNIVVKKNFMEAKSDFGRRIPMGGQTTFPRIRKRC